MLGAIVGDVIGSRHEFNPLRKRGTELVGLGCDFTDDTVCTMAVAQGILYDEDPAQALRKWGRALPQRGYGGMFQAWLNETTYGDGYGSYGNGAVMRISPVAMFATSLEEAEALALRWTAITHGHPDAMDSAVALVRILVRLRDGAPDYRQVIQEEMAHAGIPIESVEQYYEAGGFRIEATHTLARACASVLEADSFEAVMHNVLYIGSDTDTTAATAGPIAELIWGVPEDLAWQVFQQFSYKNTQIIKMLASWYQEERCQLPKDQPWTIRIGQHLFIDPMGVQQNDICGLTPRTGNRFAKITYVSQATLHLIKPKPNVAVISIRDPGNDHLVDTGGWGMLLEASFLDIRDEQLSGLRAWLAGLKAGQPVMEKISGLLSKRDGWTWRPMFDCDAKRMADFINQAFHAGMDELLVACEYGKSRSAGIAVAAHEAFGADQFTYPANHSDRAHRLTLAHLEAGRMH